MTSFVKLMKDDVVSSVVVTSVVPIDRAEVSRDGLRAVDSGMFTVPSRISANIGEVYKYLQDVADTTYLRGAYLFQGSCLDESGYNVDPIDQTNTLIAGDNQFDGLQYALTTLPDSSNKFYNFYKAKVTAGTKGVILENKTLPNGSPVHDFSNDFDIIAWVTVPSAGTGSQTIYAKYDPVTTKGIEIRIVGTGSPATYYAHVAFKNQTAGSESLNGSSKTVAAGSTVCVRVRRISDTWDLWFETGIETTQFSTPLVTKSGTSKTSGDFNVSIQATIGARALTVSGNNVSTSTNQFSNDTSGLHSLRIYCGGTLDIFSAVQIIQSRPIPLIMKLAGNVWKIESNIDEKKIYVKGFGKIITDTLISDSILTTGTATGEFYETSGIRTLTNFTNATPIEIIRAIFSKLNVTLVSSPFKLSVRRLTTEDHTINTYDATGNLLEIIDQLMVIADQSFYVSPRGRCIIEDKDINLTVSLKFDKKYNINVDGFDDSLTTNDLYLSTRAGGSFNILHKTDLTSIGLIGLYSKRIIAPQLTDAAAGIIFGNNFITSHKDVNSRYTIQAPTLINFIRENFLVKIVNKVKFANIVDNSVNKTIKSITWTYPEGKTVFEAGDFLVDAFDIEKTSSETIQNLVTDTNLNP